MVAAKMGGAFGGEKEIRWTVERVLLLRAHNDRLIGADRQIPINFHRKRPLNVPRVLISH